MSGGRRSIGGAATLVAATASASRILGFVRDALIAAAFGGGPIADALLLALRIPNLLRRVLAEGGLNAGFVPIYARLSEAQPDDARRFAANALATVAVATFALVALCHLAVPLIVAGLTGGGAGGIEARATAYIRASLPFVLFGTLAALLGAWLNAERRFLAAAIAPLAVNIVLIAVLIGLSADIVPLSDETAALVFAWGWTLAGLVQLAMIAWGTRALWPRGFVPRVTFGGDERVLILRALPAMAASGSAHVIVLAATILAAATPGAISWLYYAERLIQLPLGFVSAAMGIVLLPAIAARLVASDREGLNQAQTRALEAVLALTLPAAVALAMLAEPIVIVLFERGAFGIEDRRQTALILMGLAPALVGAGAAKVLAQTAFADERVGLPLLAIVAGVAATLLSGFVLAPVLGPASLGLAVALGLVADSLVLAVALWRRGLWRPDRRLMTRAARLALATAIMALAIGLAQRLAKGVIGAPDPLWSTLALFGTCLLGLVVFAAAAWSLRANTPQDVGDLVRRRVGGA